MGITEKTRRLFSPEMDPGVWSRLPQDLLEHVLSFLPLKNLLKLRSTCKHFKTLLFSPSFISGHLSSSSSSSSSSLSFLLLSHPQFHHQYPLFDTLLNDWRSLSLSPSPLQPRTSSSELLSSSNGLLCFSDPNSSSFVVCNLLTRSSAVVKFPRLPFTFELLTLVSTSKGGSYKLFMMSCLGSSSETLVYDSKLCSWSQFEGVDLFFSENYNQDGVFYNGCLYFITSEPFDTLCFDFEKGNWHTSTLVLPRGLTFARLCSDSGSKLYLIGGCGTSGISRSMKLWELSQEQGNWMEVETVPEMMCRKFLSVTYHNYDHVYCFWHQGLICLCCYNWPEILYYKVARRTWHWVPKSPSLPQKWSCGFRWFSFVPELSAIV